MTEPLGPVTGPARVVIRTRFAGEDWEPWSWARPKTVHRDAAAARRSFDGPFPRVSLWFLERGGLGGRTDLALRVQYGVVPAEATKP